MPRRSPGRPPWCAAQLSMEILALVANSISRQILRVLPSRPFRGACGDPNLARGDQHLRCGDHAVMLR